MVNALQVYNILDSEIPFSSQESWDNSGLLINTGEHTDTVLVCLDVTKAAVDRAVEAGAKIIVSHHPVIFSGLTQIDCNHIVYTLIKNDISVISAHTNFDKYRYGTCYAMADKLELAAEYDENIEIGLKAAVNEKLTVKHLAEKCKAVFGTAACTLPDNQVKKVFICAGSGGGMTEEILASGADCYITGEGKYHDMLDLAALGVAVITTAHDASEKISLEALAGIITKSNKDIKTEIYIAENLQYVL
ncbi:MAG: Nif3-like dinuclear metal center hexameric protein [Oscillospiraceae bacterium]|nr:Nif3-like dinuclear metal center hexameric protein [Oscillospiraceae bacterium]